MTLTLIFGISNAGKTTYSKKYEDVIHLDDFLSPRHRSYEELNEYVKDLQRYIFVEGLYLRREFRVNLIKATPNHKHIAILLKAPLDELIKREGEYRKRGDGFVRFQNRVFEPPTYSEGWDEIIEINNYEGKHDDHNNSNHQP